MSCDSCEYWAFDEKLDYYDGREYGDCNIAFGVDVVFINRESIV